MSLASSPYLVRLQELKLWQGNYDNLLQKHKEKTEDVDLSDIDGSDDIPMNNSKFSPKTPNGTTEFVDIDRQVILPTTKPFNELIEAKLAEDIPSLSPLKPKQPFLKKGAGLARYKLTPTTCASKTKKKTPVINKNHEKQYGTTPKSSNQEHMSITPLKVPEASIKCKAKWKKVEREEESLTKQDEAKFDSNYIIDKINEFAHSFHPTRQDKNENRVWQKPQKHDNYEKEKFPENLCINKSDQELKIFEMLEEKVDHSSFLSSNASILRLLGTTPNSNHSSPKKRPSSEDFNGYQQHKSNDVFAKVLNCLKLISSETTNGYCMDNQSRKSTSDSSSLFDEKTPHSLCNSSFYSEFETTLRGKGVNKAINTSFQSDIGCSDCIKLRNELDGLQTESYKFASENSRLISRGRELERQCDLLNTEIKRLRDDYEKDVDDLRNEVEEERSKFAREKALVDMYVSDLRPKKKEIIEVDNLKKELLDLKELLKLKETKNGTTQARLRNQIKQLEKENSELKSSVEQLQKENAKLNATQIVHRKAETRMLQQISRNLNRLTEETLKDVDNSDAADNEKKDKSKFKKREKEKSFGELKGRIGKAKQVEVSKQNSKEKTLGSVEVIYNNEDLDKEYESAFGLVDEELTRNDSPNLSRKVLMEKEFPDGSKEIKFANGTSKTISPDGNLTYMQYANGDIRETDLIKQTQKYYFAKKSVWLTKYSDGTELTEFPNGQKEKRFPDGKVHVTTTDGRMLTKFPDGSQEVNYPDGSRMVIENNEKIIYLPNGQKEIQNPNFKKREYPNGTVKIVYPDGTQESRYASGRVRIKNANGTLIMDNYTEETN